MKHPFVHLFPNLKIDKPNDTFSDDGDYIET